MGNREETENFAQKPPIPRAVFSMSGSRGVNRKAANAFAPDRPPKGRGSAAGTVNKTSPKGLQFKV
jgi:hypothetical protein